MGANLVGRIRPTGSRPEDTVLAGTLSFTLWSQVRILLILHKAAVHGLFFCGFESEGRYRETDVSSPRPALRTVPGILGSTRPCRLRSHRHLVDALATVLEPALLLDGDRVQGGRGEFSMGGEALSPLPESPGPRRVSTNAVERGVPIRQVRGRGGPSRGSPSTAMASSPSGSKGHREKYRFLPVVEKIPCQPEVAFRATRSGVPRRTCRPECHSRGTPPRPPPHQRRRSQRPPPVRTA